MEGRRPRRPWTAGTLSLQIFLLTLSAQGAIRLGEGEPYRVQGDGFSIADDTNSVGIEIECDIIWYNTSDNVSANNQISANGTFGSNDCGLVEITTRDSTHSGFHKTPPTYTINSNSFNIAYAPGAVNEPGRNDTFKFHFNLGTTNEATAQAAVEELNACIDGTLDWHNSLYVLQATINGEVVRDGIFYKPFENSPVVYVPWLAGMEKDEHGVWPGWYRQHSTTADADPDTDGYLSWQEYICGTDPTNGLDFLQFSISSNALHVSTVTNRNYLIESCGTLGGGTSSTSSVVRVEPDPPWQPFTNFTGTGTTVDIPLVHNPTSAFFRVEVSLP